MRCSSLQWSHRTNVPSWCSSQLSVKLQRKRNMHHRCQLAGEENTSWRDGKRNTWTDVGVFRCLSPSIKHLSCHCEGPAPNLTPWLGLGRIFASGNCCSPKESLKFLFKAGWEGCHAWHTSQQHQWHSSERKGKVDEKMLPCYQSSPHYPLTASQDFKHLHLFLDGFSTRQWAAG